MCELQNKCYQKELFVQAFVSGYLDTLRSLASQLKAEKLWTAIYR
jgi:hypothetical protein